MIKPVRSFARFLFGKILPRKAYPVLRGPLRGAKFILGSHGGLGGGASVYFNTSEKEQTNAFVQYVKPGSILFDVGANVGHYTVLGSRLVSNTGKVIAFEPLIRNLSYLYRHIQLNKLTNVDIIGVACAESISIATFDFGPETSMGYLVEAGAEEHIQSVFKSNVTLVPVVSLDEIASKLNCMPDVLKIDVEGAEMAVLKGAEYIISQLKPVIFLSLHSEALKRECLAHLKIFGYQFKPLNNTDFDYAMEFLCIRA